MKKYMMKILSDFGSALFLLPVAHMIFIPYYNDNLFLWQLVLFLFTLMVLVWIARLSFLIAVKMGIKHDGKLEVKDSKVSACYKIITIEYKPPFCMNLPIESKITWKSNSKSYVSSTELLLPYTPCEFIFENIDVKDLLSNKEEIEIWYKIDIGVYSEWSKIKKNFIFFYNK